jgi:UDP-N-acetyl-D-mannosaminuronic acid dehydrogenase
LKNNLNAIDKRISQKTAQIAVVGLGYVGLPTAALFAENGFNVTGFDINQKIVNEINSSTISSNEPNLGELVATARKKGLLKATFVPSETMQDADVIIVCVQTPVDKEGNANLSYLQSAFNEVSKYFKKGSLLIVQSTVPPNTIRGLIIPLLEKTRELKCGTDFWLAYCPERLAPGNGLQDLNANSRLIGGYDSASAEICSKLFKLVTNGHLLITDMQSAEVSKLAENTFRYVNIAYANELAIICKQLGVDVKEVIRLANTHPRVNIHQPGCGAGGPCLSKDSHLLIASSGQKLRGAKVIPAAISVNNNMPKYIAKLAVDSLKKNGKDIRKSKIAVFGTAYKGDVDDSRDSPSEGIIRELSQKNANLVVFDPHCSESFGAQKAKNLTEAAKDADCVILAVEHKAFLELDLSKIKSLMKENPVIVDGKRIINPAEARRIGFEYVAASNA